jgi:amino acid adenylation domain-containing protein
MYSMSDYVTIIEALSGHAKRNPTGIAYRFLKESNAAPVELSYQQLFRQVVAVAHELQLMARPGDRVLLMFPAGEAYIVAFLACMMAGCIAVPLYPPRPNQKMFRTNAVIDDCGASLLLTNSQVGEVVAQLQAIAAIAMMPVLVTDGITDPPEHFVPPSIEQDTIAFLQYTSGSTGNPKGVMVSHRNLIENEKSIAIGFKTNPQDVCLNWLPMYHDMGLIGSVLQPLYMGCISILMTPSAFIRDPLSWLEAITLYKATKCGAANFAFELLCQRYDANRAAKLDLTSIQLMFSGAEPVRAATLARFSELYQSVGFCYDTFYPCYGMAEATLFMTGSDHHRDVTVRAFDEQQLSLGHALPCTEAGAGKALTACGVSKPGHVVLIVDPETCEPKTAGQIGEIWFDGPSKAQGYWGKPESAEVFQARIAGQEGSYLRTGDLGFMLDGQLYVTGRRKDLIIIHGRNYYPQDIEVTVAASNPAFNADNCAAFSVEVAGEEVLVVAQEIQRTAMRQLDKTAAILQIRTSVAVEHQLELHDVLLLKPGSLAKTTSGKVQRYRNRELYLAREHQALASLRQADSQVELTKEQHQEPLLTLINQYVAVPADADDNTALIALGLDSLKAATLCYALQQQYGLSIEFYELLNDITLGQLRAKVKQSDQTTTIGLGSQPDLAVEADGSPVMMSVLQQQLWTAYMADPASSANNLAVAFEVDNRFEPAVFNQALALLCADFPLLQVHFTVAAGSPVAHRVSHPLVIDYPQPDSSLSFSQQVAALASAPFDLFSQLPIRVQLLANPDSATQVIVIALHHLVADYDAATVLLTRLSAQYVACANQQILPALAGNISRFTAQHNRWLAGSDVATARAFWSGYLADFNSRLPLRTSRKRPAVRNFVGQSIAVALNASLSVQLQQLAKRHGVTPFTLILTIYAVTLSRLCDRQDFTIGVPFNCAAGTAAEQEMGYHINALPVRFQYTEQQPLSQMLAKVKHDLQLILQHRQYPSEWIAREESKEVNGAYAPLFQVLFSYYTARHQQLNIGPMFLNDGYQMVMGDVITHSVKVPRLASQFDLSLSLAESDGGYIGEFEFSTELFDQQSVAVWRDVFVQLCEQLTADEDALPFNVPMLSLVQKQHIQRWSSGQTLAESIEFNPLRRILQHCESSADQIAMISAQETLTYRELQERLETITAGLLAQGVRPGERVAFYADRKVNTIILMFALVQVGAAFIPLDLSAPTEYLNGILATVQPKFVVVDEALESPDFRSPQVLLGDLMQHGKSTLSPWHDAAELLRNSSAYILFTSGSTGKPKGVDVTYANLDYFIEWTLAYFDEKWFSNLLCATNFSFDVAMFETFSVMAAGGTITLVQSILQMPDDTQIDAVIGTASSVYEALRGQRLRPEIARMILTGEAPDATTVLMLQTEYNIGQILNAYGPTESTVWSSIADITTAKERITNIGGPVPGTQNWVVDSHFNLVPPGVEGELLLGGDGITRGYINQPQQTAAAFVCDDFAPQQGKRLYRTGDRVYWDYDGQLIYLDRRDNQVNIRGYRIELSEVEYVLRSLPGIAQAVMVKYTAAERDAMAGFVVCAPGVVLSEIQVLRLLAKQLPVAMLPGTIKFLDTFPINRNGKTDKKALQQLLLQPNPVPVAGNLRRFAHNQLLRHEMLLPARLHDRVGQLAQRSYRPAAAFYLAAYCLLMGRWFGNDTVSVSVYSEAGHQHGTRVVQLAECTFEEIVAQLSTEPVGNAEANTEHAFAFGSWLHDFYAPVTTGLSLCEQQGALLACWQFAANDWLDFSRESLMQAYPSVLNAICQMPALPGSDIPLQCYDSWIKQARSSYSPRLVVEQSALSEAFSFQVQRQMHKLAICQGSLQLSYLQLDQWVNRCAAALQQAGLCPGHTVAICLGNNLINVVAVLAVWRFGGCVVTIDPALPVSRIGYMLQDAAVSACIIEKDNPQRYQSSGCFIVLDEQAQLLAVEQATHSRQTKTTTPTLACVLYTSGSTGHPKGVMLSHNNILSYAAATKQLYQTDANARVLQFSNVGFDIFLEELSLSLLSGALLVIPDEDIKQDAQVFWSFIKSQQISVTSLPTAFWHMLVEQLDESQATLACTHLTTVITGGEAMSCTLLQRWHQLVAADTVALYNTYGPTEGTVIATAYRTDASMQTAMVPIGHAIDNAFTLVLDSQMRPVPAGAVGELYIGGQGVALGYLGREDLTEQVFVANPFQPGERLYRTGDMVRHSGELGLVFLGRQDHQIKISGFRVEPAEIEVAIEGFQGVNRALVLGQMTEHQHKVLVAYVQWYDEATPALLQTYLSEQLPAYMVPKQYVEIKTWPLTTNGKTDRTALPKAVLPAHTVHYSSATEQQLAAIVASLLGQQGLSVDQDFLSLGLNSIQAAKLLGEVRVIFQLRIDFRQLFEFSSIASLAAFIESRQDKLHSHSRSGEETETMEILL